MSRVLELISSLAGNSTSKQPTATVTPVVDDNTKNLATTEWFFKEFTGAAKVQLGTNGYMVMPNGLIVQWGTVLKSSSANVSITFPLTFPAGVYTTVASFGGTSAPAAGVSAYPTSTSQCTFYSSAGAAGVYVNWVAIGH
jgi:hypothetical protein